jgi:serine/threonine protein phosphatase PrpC
VVIIEMGSGASTELNAEQKASLVAEARSVYESGSTGGEADDVELFTTVSDAVTTKYSQYVTGTATTSATTDSGSQEAITVDDGDKIGGPETEEGIVRPSVLAQRTESVGEVVRNAAGEVVQVSDDEAEWSSDDDEHHIAISKPRKGSTGLLMTKTSQAMLEDLIGEEADRQAKVAEFLSQIKDGNVIQSKASKFRDRRLTFSHKEEKDPTQLKAVESPPKLIRKRTTIYSSTEIGVRQEKKAPFDSMLMGTYSCHGIEPGDDYDDDMEYDVPPHDKINQDRGCVVHPFATDPKKALFVVMDGHGEQGDAVSEFVMRQLVMSLEKHELLESDPVEALKDTFIRTNMALMLAPINYMTSGTTVTAAFMVGTTIYCANCGDSRTVLAKKKEGGGHTSVDLSRDHKPDDPVEAARIIDWGGFIRPAAEPGLSARVYLDEAFTMIGLAMARSIGDFAVKSVGVIPEPEVKIFELEKDVDEFMILASDGVWEFISSQEAVDIVSDKLAEGLECHAACQELIEQASERWAEEEGDYRDDITAIVIRLPLPFHYASD